MSPDFLLASVASGIPSQLEVKQGAGQGLVSLLRLFSLVSLVSLVSLFSLIPSSWGLAAHHRAGCQTYHSHLKKLDNFSSVKNSKKVNFPNMSGATINHQ